MKVFHTNKALNQNMKINTMYKMEEYIDYKISTNLLSFMLLLSY